MQAATRFPLERIAALDRAVRADRYLNARTLSEYLEVCRRTAPRDVEFPRDRLEAPVAFDPVRNGYHYTEPNFRLLAVAIAERELLGLVLAGRPFQKHRGKLYGLDLARAISKIARALGDIVMSDLGKLAADCSLRASPSPSPDPNVFQGLGSAVKHRRKVMMEYWTASRDVETLRIVDPYHLTRVEGRWHLIAHCRPRGTVKAFSISSIRRMEVLDESFERPVYFNISTLKYVSIPAFEDVKRHRYAIRLHFRGVAARKAARLNVAPPE